MIEIESESGIEIGIKIENEIEMEGFAKPLPYQLQICLDRTQK